jgi:O-antigen ligase
MNNAQFRYARFVETAAASLLMLYPGLMFAVKGGMNGSFLLLLLLALGVLLIRPRELASVTWDRELVIYIGAMAALPIAIFLSQSYHHAYSGHPYDAASRFLLAIPIFILLQRLRFNVVAAAQYGFPLAAIVGWLIAKPIAFGRIGISTLDLIHFGDFELMLGALSALSINWTGRDDLLLRGLKIAGFLAGMYASIASGSRGGWVALPIFLLIFIYFKYGKISLKAFIALPTILIAAGFMAYSLSQAIHHRVDEAVSDVTAIHHGNPDTPTGVRWQLFQAAAVVISKNPLFGVGPEGFAREMDPMLKAGQVTVMAAGLGKGEVHNELLSKTAALGIFGLIAMLLIYLVPFRFFYRAMRSEYTQVKQAGLLGLVFVSGFMVFGLTVEILNLTMAAAFYSLTVAVLLAACYNIHHSDQIAKNNS